MRKDKALMAVAEEIDLHLRTVRQVLRQPVEAEVARGGLTGPQRRVMHFLVHSNGRSLKELSKDVGLSHSTVSGIVDRLERRGLAERQVDRKDRRISRIVASKRVQNYMRTMLPSLILNPLAQALRQAKPRERLIILDGLRTLRSLVNTALPHA